MEITGRSTRRALAAAAVAALAAAGTTLVAGCARTATGATPLSAVRSTLSPSSAPHLPSRPSSPSPHSQHNRQIRQKPDLVATTITRAQTIDGDEYAPPPAGQRPRISAARAFALARHSFGDPRGTATTEVALTSYTNGSQGTILADGSVRLSDVRRFSWAVIDRGGSCRPTGAPPPTSVSPAPIETPYHDCLWVTFVDARTGAVFGSTETGGPGAPQLKPGSPR